MVEFLNKEIRIAVLKVEYECSVKDTEKSEETEQEPAKGQFELTVGFSIIDLIIGGLLLAGVVFVIVKGF